MRKNKIFTNILLVVFAVIFVVSGYMLFSNIIKGNKEQAAFDEMSAAVHQAEEKPAVDTNKLLLEEYARLKTENDHFIGWINIDGTQLDYPVMHTPLTPEYYLRKNFDKSYAISGTPFLDANCTTDSNVMLVYGHHMNNGTMFATLHLYKDKNFWQEHKEIRFDTLTELRTYEIVSAFYTEIKDVNDTESFKYYNYMGDLSAEDFDYYSKNIKAMSLYDTGIEISADDRLLTLSTCSYHDEYGRFVVVAKLKDILIP